MTGHRDPHEARDASARGVLLFAAALALLIAAASVAMRLIYRGSFAGPRTREAAAPPFGEVQPPPAAPPIGDLLKIRGELAAYEDALLTRYEWVDRAHGRVRIPIERAMAIVAARKGGAS